MQCNRCEIGRGFNCEEDRHTRILTLQPRSRRFAPHRYTDGCKACLRRYNWVMPAITLEPQRYAEIHALLDARTWTVSCLCAAWCDVCTEFRTRFDQLAAQHPGMVMLWIDIEDRADLVDEFDVENFPTLLIQRGNDIVFLGTVEPDAASVNRLIMSQTREETDPRAPAMRHPLQEKLAELLHAGL